KMSRFITKSSMGARSMPVVSPLRLRLWRRIRISELEVVGQELGLAACAGLEVEDGVEAGDADREARHRADHRVGGNACPGPRSRVAPSNRRPRACRSRCRSGPGAARAAPAPS